MNVRSFAITGLCVFALTACVDRISYPLVEESDAVVGSAETRADEDE